MTPYLEKAAEVLALHMVGRTVGSANARELTLLVAEALYPETPEPERIEAMGVMMCCNGECVHMGRGLHCAKENYKAQAAGAYAAERKLVLGP